MKQINVRASKGFTPLRLPVWWGAFVLALMTSGCGRPGGGGSRVLVQVPTAEQMASGGASRQAIADFNRLCFYINAVADDMELRKDRCDTDKGIVTAGVGPGGLLEVEVPFGNHRKIQILGYERLLSTEACPSLVETLPKAHRRRYHRLGESDLFNVTAAEMSVKVNIQVPDRGSNLVTQLGLPADCLPATAPSNFGGFRVGFHEAAGTNMKLQSRVAPQFEMKTYTGSQIKLQGRVRK